MDYDDETVLLKAASYGRVEIVQLLLQCPNIDVNAQTSLGENALLRVTWRGLAETLEEKVRENALYQNRLEIVRLLLQHPDINVNAKNTFDQTALNQTSAYGHLEMMELLLKCANVDLHVKGHNGKSVVGICCSEATAEKKVNKAVMVSLLQVTMKKA